MNRLDERKLLVGLKVKYEEYLLNINERIKEIDSEGVKDEQQFNIN